MNTNEITTGTDQFWIDPEKRILIVGASGDIGNAVLRLITPRQGKIGAHYHTNRQPLQCFADDNKLGDSQLKLFGADLSGQKSCHDLIDSFIEWAGGIDGLIQLTGDVRRPCTWEELSEEDWLADINVNLSGPFFLAQRAMKHMKSEKGARVVLMSTASAQHGGGGTSMAYGVAKAGIECLTKGLARQGAPHGILVNAIAPGFIETKFHTETMGRDSETLKKRAELVPLKRPGRPEDVARMIVYLLSSGGDYLTGECFAISGGDWL